MRYSRNEINRQGETLLKSSCDEEIKIASDKINQWRTDHILPLESLKEKIVNILTESKLNIVLVSNRIKRLRSIIYKIDINPSMGLGGMNDIGGIRVVFNDIEDVERAFDLLKCSMGPFIFDNKVNNYILNPKDSGYRSIHLIYKLKSNDYIYDNLKFELQIRTKLQHAWATALETVDVHTKEALKSGYGSDDWKQFFKLVSALFSHKENRNVIKEYRDLHLYDLMGEYYNHVKEKRTLALIKAFKKSVDHNITNVNEQNSDYYILRVDLEKRLLKVISYKKEDLNIATEDYYEYEKSIASTNDHAIVLVSTNSYRMLEQAYPSYFMDIDDFINNLDTVLENYEKYIKGK